MKLSAWHKSQGDIAGFDVENPNIVYTSIVFKKNAHKLDELKKKYGEKLICGGSGIGLDKKLIDAIEYIKPDYALYPEMDYSLGFTTRGCIRNCYFCIVNKKEGKLTRWQHPSLFHDQQFKTIQLLDNNWMADREWFLETSDWIINHDLKLIENGLDIRLLDMELAEQIARFKMAKPLKFAFDSDKDKQPVLDGLKLLKDAGVNVRQNVQFYVYVHDDGQYESGVERCRILKENGTNAFVMFNTDSLRTDRIKNLQRWANRKWLFWGTDIDNYIPGFKK
jgi:hypothetical protein